MGYRTADAMDLRYRRPLRSSRLLRILCGGERLGRRVRKEDAKDAKHCITLIRLLLLTLLSIVVSYSLQQKLNVRK